MKNITKYIHSIMLALLVISMGLGGFTPNVAAAQGLNNWQNQNQRQILLHTDRMSYQDLHRLVQLLTQLRNRLQQLTRLRTQINIDFDSDVQISTLSAIEIELDEAVLRGSVVDFNDSSYADVWFEYGTESNELNEDTLTMRIDDNYNGNFSRRVTGLDEDTRYYFRAVGESDINDRDYGLIRNFRTDSDSSNQDDDPTVTTLSATSVSDEDATLRGSVDMHDFDNGIVFFVYGESESMVEEVDTDFGTYDEVDEDSYDLEKVRVHTDLDTSGTFTLNVSGLHDDEEHYFRICVEYEDKDDDDVLECGGVRTFKTD